MTICRQLRRTLVAATLIFVAAGGAASAATLTYQPNPSDMQDLDHTYMYAWKINNLNTSIPSGQVVTGASLFFDNIANWNNSANKLFLHLLDTVLTSSGNLIGSNANTALYRAVDDTTDTVISDAFAVNGTSNYYGSSPNTNSLVADGTKNTALGNFSSTDANGRVSSWIVGATGLALNANGNYSFSTTPMDYTYNFDAGQIAKLNEYLNTGGDIALALDPDCHFFNSGITLTLTTGPTNLVPEPVSLALLGLGFGAAYVRRRRAARRATA